MAYSIEILRSAEKQLSRISQKDQARVIKAIRSLAEDPRPSSCKKLSGRPAWRIPIGTYRVIYEIDDGRILITIVTIGHRRDVYR